MEIDGPIISTISGDGMIGRTPRGIVWVKYKLEYTDEGPGLLILGGEIRITQNHIPNISPNSKTIVKQILIDSFMNIDDFMQLYPYVNFSSLPDFGGF